MKRNSLLLALNFFVSSSIVTLCIVTMSYAFFGALSAWKSNTSPTFSSKKDDFVLVIDAGHGGEDAGAVASDGTLEKDLNLEIALALSALCELNGTRHIMTREDDRLLYDLYDDLEDYTGHKKLYDLKNRVRLTRECEGAVFVSIHMNKFPQEKYSGTQVYFSKNNAQSELFAREIQNTIRLNLQPNNNRQIKGATSDIYVLNSLECPAILIECGFLSNESELSLLKSDPYRAKLALTVFSAVLSRSS